MWVIAAVMLSVVAVACLVGLHAGPHGLVAAGALGVLAAVWLVAMAATGRANETLWVLFGGDVVVSGGSLALAWRGIQSARSRPVPAGAASLEGAEGVAVTDLVPAGMVRVAGETWSAESVRGTVRAGAPVQVIKVDGVHLAVWPEGEELGPLSSVGDAELPEEPA
ncbi:MAG: NfeD family protein [Acidimicrobiales bacterium]